MDYFGTSPIAISTTLDIVLRAALPLDQLLIFLRNFVHQSAETLLPLLLPRSYFANLPRSSTVRGTEGHGFVFDTMTIDFALESDVLGKGRYTNLRHLLTLDTY